MTSKFNRLGIDSALKRYQSDIEDREKAIKVLESVKANRCELEKLLQDNSIAVKKVTSSEFTNYWLLIIRLDVDENDLYSLDTRLTQMLGVEIKRDTDGSDVVRCLECTWRDIPIIFFSNRKRRFIPED